MNFDAIAILNQPNNKLIAVDIDGTLCEGEFWGEGEPTPCQRVIDIITDLYQRGGHIIIYSARRPKYYQLTLAWLIKHDVPFHGVCLGVKCGADLYIDDHAINVEDMLNRG
jgi:uncharacterized HAD superfamily protein